MEAGTIPFFGAETGGSVFSLFSVTHGIALAFALSGCVMMVIFRNLFANVRWARFFRFLLLLLLVLCETGLRLWYIVNDRWDVRYTLPLELCSVALILSIAMLLFRSYRLYEFVYFAGIGGSLQALFTPDLLYDFPHYIFVQFFIAHALIIYACLFMTFAYGYRPTGKSIVRTFVWLNVLALCVYLFNAVTGANYMFLMEKPAGGSLLDWLGPWPYYIIGMEAVALGVFVLLYLPFSRRKIS